MALTLAGSCRCGSVHFTMQSHTPHPYQLCYCSICRKTAGGGGFAINLMGVAASLDVKGRKAIGTFHAEIRQDSGACDVSEAERSHCRRCGTALWLYSAAYPTLIHPFASAIDTALPVPPMRVHILLRYKAPWIVPAIGPKDHSFDNYPMESIEEWHRSRGLWVD